jgi:hypothetical protein
MKQLTLLPFVLGFGAACHHGGNLSTTSTAAAGAPASGPAPSAPSPSPSTPIATPEQHATTEGTAGRTAAESPSNVATNVQALGTAPEPLAHPSVVEGCQPCLVVISRNSPPYSVTFDVLDSEDGKVVRELRVLRRDQPSKVMSLPVHDMTPADEGDGFFFGPIDINFDGYSDLMLATSRGASNTYADYWVFSADAGEFRYTGNYPLLHVDAAKHRLSSHENNGSAGREYTNKLYAAEGSKLVLIEQEIQEAGGEPGTFVKARSRADAHGKLSVVKRETVRSR